MIVYDLTCENGHTFESWFGSSSAYDRLAEAGQVVCPHCGTTEVTKAPMAPRISKKGRSNAQIPHDDEGDSTPMAGGGQIAQVLEKARDYVESNFEDVGEKFPEEARKIHYGESEERGIYGEASAEDAHELLEEGIDVLPLPKKRRTDA